MLRRSPAAPRERRPSLIALWPPGAQAIATLAADGCRWPLGEVQDEEFRFCNAPKIRGSYCAKHRMVSRAGAAR